MSEEPEDTSPEAFPHPGDLGRRVAARRAELGLSREEVAGRAGMAESYVRYVEEKPAEVPIGALLRLAAALETVPGRLLGGHVDAPPGRAPAAARPALARLEPAECREHLEHRGVGRVAVVTPEGPAVFPVNYAMVAGAIVFRTTPGSAPAAAVDHEVCFEVDQVDDVLSQGWSVLVVGRAERIADAESVQGPADPVLSSWAGGTRDLWVRILPTRITGRSIQAA
ncbi:pyridoxamine 5'-phosphate oxidase family protein [Streptacidiphilus griseoplanus]|uniref:pyridoxamine 5'-phosphate oxidase family protein n=1 Tax=Peterkaempfera griseoplana TaxID=66896 RepID=UPI0006E3F12F|nr:pyridoxamine 5'-phosphate oxidase family protein [Peterkaempfera griseoplana]